MAHDCVLSYYVIIMIITGGDGLIGTYCGTGGVSTVYTSGEEAYIEFHTDESIERRGFQMFYQAIGR